jgi:hypothetical protein
MSSLYVFFAVVISAQPPELEIVFYQPLRAKSKWKLKGKTHGKLETSNDRQC